MADNNIDMAALAKAVAELNKVLNGRSGNSSAALNTWRTHNTTTATSYGKGTADKATAGSDKELERLKAKLEAAGNDQERITKMYKMLAKYGSGAAEALQNSERDLAKYSKAQRELIEKTMEQIKGLKTAEQKRQFLEKMNDTLKKDLGELDAAIIRHSKSINVLDSLGKKQEKVAAESIAEQKSYNEALAKLRSSYTKASKGRRPGIQKKIDDLESSHISNQKSLKNKGEKLKARSDRVKNYSDRKVDVVSDFSKKYSDAISKDAIDKLKSASTLNGKARKEAMRDAYAGIKNGASEVGGSISAVARTIEVGNDKVGKGLQALTRTLEVGGIILKNLFEDMKVRDQNNVDTTSYVANILRGVSDQERSRAIGENRIQMRQMGNGDEAAGFARSADIQRAAHMFGVTGAEALQKALQYQRLTGTTMGINYSNTDATKLQMSFMRDFAKQIGATDNQLADFYSSLGEMGEMGALYAQNLNKSEAERQKSMNNEIYTRAKLNASMGITLQMQKQQQQQAINARYSTLGQTIRKQIGTQMRVQMYNQSHPNSQISDSDSKFLGRVAAAGGGGTLTDKKDITRYNNLSQQLNLGEAAQLKTDQENAVSGKDQNAMYGDRVNNQILGSLGVDRQSDNNFYTQSAMNRSAQGKNGIDNSKDFNATIKDATNSMNGPKGFTAAVYNVTEALDGLAKSPIFSGVVGIGGSLMGAIAGHFISKAIGKIGSSIYGKMGEGKNLRDALRETISEARSAVKPSKISESIKNGASKAWDATKGAASKVAPYASKTWEGIKTGATKAAPYASKVWEGIKTGATKAAPYVSKAWDATKGAASKAAPYVSKAWDGIKAVADSPLGKIVGAGIKHAGLPIAIGMGALGTLNDIRDGDLARYRKSKGLDDTIIGNTAAVTGDTVRHMGNNIGLGWLGNTKIFESIFGKNNFLNNAFGDIKDSNTSNKIGPNNPDSSSTITGKPVDRSDKPSINSQIKNSDDANTIAAAAAKPKSFLETFGDDMLDILKDIAQTNTDMNNRDAKDSANKQNAKIGSLYKSYEDHMNNLVGSLS